MTKEERLKQVYETYLDIELKYLDNLNKCFDIGREINKIIYDFIDKNLSGDYPDTNPHESKLAFLEYKEFVFELQRKLALLEIQEERCNECFRLQNFYEEEYNKLKGEVDVQN